MTLLQRVCLTALVGFFICSAQLGATPLTMYYEVTSQGGGIYRYDFTLTLDNNDGSWIAGQTFNWIVFGDQESAPTNLTDFVGDLAFLPIGPFPIYTTSGGGHNGPTLVITTTPLEDYGWVPAAIGESLHWGGTSTANLGQGELLWSNFYPQDAGNQALFVAATLTTPEPSTLMLLGAGLVSVVWRRRRFTRLAVARRA